MRDYAIHKKASHLFDTWQLNQDIFNDEPILATRKNEKRVYDYYQRLKNDYQKYPGALRQLEILWIGNDLANKALKNTAEFIAYLEKKQFCSKAIYDEELNWSINKVINKYNKFLRLLFIHVSHAKQNCLLYIVANNFFIYCFDPSNEKIDEMITQRRLEPLARMMYAIMWKHLGGRGWQSWHKKTIDALKHEAQKGNEIIYIAGGSDINQLLKNNIYNIRVIDPFLPTQDTYYSRGWRFLVRGVPGDTIEWTLENHTLFLKRSYYQEHGMFTATLSNDKEKKVPKATIVWDIYNDKKQKCSQITIERRFTTQEDFKYKEDKKILISFNELYFITTLHEGGWGINISQFDERCMIYIKQLSKPVMKDMLLRMQEIDDTFEFIQLGNCIN